VKGAESGTAANVSIIELLNFMRWLQRHVTALKLAPGETGDQFLDPTRKTIAVPIRWHEFHSHANLQSMSCFWPDCKSTMPIEYS
jgi:hypothetical protein